MRDRSLHFETSNKTPPKFTGGEINSLYAERANRQLFYKRIDVTVRNVPTDNLDNAVSWNKPAAIVTLYTSRTSERLDESWISSFNESREVSTNPRGLDWSNFLEFVSIRGFRVSSKLSRLEFPPLSSGRENGGGWRDSRLVEAFKRCINIKLAANRFKFSRRDGAELKAEEWASRVSWGR